MCVVFSLSDFHSSSMFCSRRAAPSTIASFSQPQQVELARLLVEEGDGLLGDHELAAHVGQPVGVDDALDRRAR
jgi:hypothetical protein